MRLRSLVKIGLLLALVVVTTVACGTSGNPGCQDCDVTGLWVGRFQSDEHSANGTFHADLAQSGADLSGDFSSPRLDLEDASLSGTQEGGSISFTDDVEHVQFEGTVSQDMTAEGAYTYPGAGDTGKWWASRVEHGSFELADCFDVEYAPIGLAHDGEALWVVSSGHLTRVDTAGTVLFEAERPGPTVGGNPRATFDGEHLWYVNYFEIFEVDTTGQEVSHHEADPATSESVEGVTHAEGQLWATESVRKLHQVDGQLNFEQTLAIAVPVPGALEYDGATLWIVSDLRFDETPLYGLDWDGWTRRLFELPSGVRVSDLAHDGQALWMAEREASRICRLQPGS